VLGKQPLDRPVHVNEVVRVDETVPLVVLGHVLDVDSTGPQWCHEMVGFGLDDARVVGALDDQQRGADLVDLGDGRASQHVGFLLRVVRIADEQVPVVGQVWPCDRVFTCACGHCMDRDRNAAMNLARWGHDHHNASPDLRTPKQRGRATNARRRDGADQHPTCAGETSPKDGGTDVHTAPAA
jgi:hypothetical protein